MAGNNVQKEIEIAVKPGTSHYHIYFKTGGQLPKELTGVFVSRRDAERAKNTYLGNKKSILKLDKDK